MSLPKWLKPFVNKNDLEGIAKAVGEAENKCNAEIVPMIVSRSTPIEFLGLLIFLSLEILILILSWTLTPHLTATEQLVGTFLLTLLAAPLSLWLCRYPSVLRMFLRSTPLKASLARRRATEEFFDLNISQTQHHTGILLFVSVLERQAVVLGDTRISALIPAEKWRDILDLLIQGLQGQNWLSGFESAVKQTAELLKDQLPAIEKKQNEIANRLIIKN